MKTLLLILAAFAAIPASAQEPVPALQKSANVDINGDGKADSVSLSSKTDSSRFTITVNGAKLSVAPDSFYDGVPGFQVLKLAGNSKSRYLAVLLVAPSDNRETRLYLYNGKTIRPAGTVPGAIVAPSGIAYSEWWMGFWQCKAKFAPGANGTVQFVPQAAYYVGKSGTVKETFVIRTEPTANAPAVANVAPGSKVELLLYKPLGKIPTMPEEGYYLIKTASGQCGWVNFKVFGKKIPDLPFAG
ncbi:MAG: hypothetical protein H7Y38_00485 [Armatimonadetes bacterium]|nr:hypothetical protein [Armatimonadota bacterium]